MWCSWSCSYVLSVVQLFFLPQSNNIDNGKSKKIRQNTSSMCNWLPVACWHGHCLCPHKKVFKTTPAKPRNATKKVKQTAKNYVAFFSPNWLNHTTICARTTITTATQIKGSLSSPRSCRVLPHTKENNNSFLVCSAAAAKRSFSTSAQNDGFWWMEKAIIIQKLFPCGGSLVLLGLKKIYFRSNYIRKPFLFPDG